MGRLGRVTLTYVVLDTYKKNIDPAGRLCGGPAGPVASTVWSVLLKFETLVFELTGRPVVSLELHDYMLLDAWIL